MTVEKKGDDFAELLKSVQALADENDNLNKSMPSGAPAPDDKKVQAAANDGEGEENPEDNEEGEGEGEGEEFGKSVTFTDGNGKQAQGVDATDLIKSLIGRLDTTDATLVQAISGLGDVVAGQQALIKSLQGEVKALAGQGRGRKTLVSIAEKPGMTMAKSEAGEGDGAITKDQLMAKATEAWNAKKISGAELNTVDVCLRHGDSINPDILRRIALA